MRFLLVIMSIQEKTITKDKTIYDKIYDSLDNNKMTVVTVKADDFDLRCYKIKHNHIKCTIITEDGFEFGILKIDKHNNIKLINNEVHDINNIVFISKKE